MKDKIIIGLLILVVGMGAYSYYQTQKDRRALYSDIRGFANKLEQLNDSTFKHLADIQDKIKIDNEAVREELKKSGATIQSLTKTTLQLQKQVIDLGAVGSIDTVEGQEFKKVSFDTTLANRTFRVSGFTLYSLQNSLAHVELKQEIPLSITTVISEMKGGLWETHLFTNNPEFKITSDSTQVNPRKKNLLQKFNWKTALAFGIIGYLIGK